MCVCVCVCVCVLCVKYFSSISKGLGEEESVSNPELLRIKEELANREDKGLLDGFGYYL